jgi:ParB family chromosome partitioning protein
MRKALGRGLAALIPTTDVQPEPTASVPTPATPCMVPIEKIRANRFQPRKNFDSEKLSELASSIKEHGLAQPIIVSHDAANDHYEIIAGERRLRACELAGLKEVEVIIRNGRSDKQRLSIALIENLQREDLNSIEQALGYLRLMKEFDINQTELTSVVGKSKSAISNTLRLLDLPDNIQKAVQFGQISEGHARALLMADSIAKKQELFKKITEDSLSVRDTEDLARSNNHTKSAEKIKIKSKYQKSADIRSLETELQHLLGTKVDIKTKKDPTKGSVTIHFYSLTDFENIVALLKVKE